MAFAQANAVLWQSNFMELVELPHCRCESDYLHVLGILPNVVLASPCDVPVIFVVIYVLFLVLFFMF